VLRQGGESGFETTRAKLGLTMVSDRFRYAESKFSCTSVIHNGVSTEIQDYEKMLTKAEIKTLSIFQDGGHPPS
jgi:hypothetical protein